MGNASLNVPLGITRTTTADAEVSRSVCRKDGHLSWVQVLLVFVVRLLQLLRLLLGSFHVPVHVLSKWTSPSPGPVCGGLWGGTVQPGQHLPKSELTQKVLLLSSCSL